MGSVELVPSFQEGVTEYTAEADESPLNFTLYASDPEAEVTVKANNKAVTVIPVKMDDTLTVSGKATLKEGANTLLITVKNGAGTTAYTVEIEYKEDDAG